MALCFVFADPWTLRENNALQLDNQGTCDIYLPVVLVFGGNSGKSINPLTPRAFCRKCASGHFDGFRAGFGPN